MEGWNVEGNASVNWRGGADEAMRQALSGRVLGWLTGRRSEGSDLRENPEWRRRIQALHEECEALRRKIQRSA